jgi:hypothetical protein
MNERSTRFASAAAHGTGHWSAFTLSIVLVLAWLVSSPVFHWSGTWQLYANTVTTVITFLMVFVLSTPRTATRWRCRSSSTASSRPLKAWMIGSWPPRTNLRSDCAGTSPTCGVTSDGAHMMPATPNRRPGSLSMCEDVASRLPRW